MRLVLFRTCERETKRKSAEEALEGEEMDDNDLGEKDVKAPLKRTWRVLPKENDLPESV